jgi:hypothetical protein
MKFLSALIVSSSLTFPALAVPPAGAHDPTISNWYGSLKQPGTNRGCCSEADCRPTELRQSPVKADEWQAFISKEMFGPDAPDTWVAIPNKMILDKTDNPTGRVVICWYQREIYCAVLPTMF